MKKTILLSLLCLILSSFLFAQSKQRIQLQSETTHLNETRYDSNGIPMTSQRSSTKFSFKLEGESNYRKVGFMGKNIKPYLETDEEAFKHFKSYKNCLNGSLMSTVVSVGSAIGFLSTNIGKEDNDQMDGPNLQNQWLIGTCLAGVLSTYIFNSSRGKHLERAIDVYNQNIDFSFKENKPKTEYRLVVDGSNCNGKFVPTIGLRLSF